MEYDEVQEGAATLRLPKAERADKGPAAKDGTVFYNPAMATNRDLSSLLLATRAKEGWDVLDGLAATGARGIRYALESPVPIRVQLNDWNPMAARLLTENAKRNGLEPLVTNRNLGPLLWELVYDTVDIDPFGSPAMFLNGATRAVRNGGLLSLTATDATALAGGASKACQRRYDAKPMHGELGHEVALRILVGSAVRTGAKHDIGYHPIFSHASDHYYRLTLEARRGAQRADTALENIGHVHLCRACGTRGFGAPHQCPQCGGPVQTAGPLWTGPLLDADTTRAMLERAPGHTLAKRDESTALLSRLDEEARAPLLFHDIHRTGSRLGIGSPSRGLVIAKLEERGFRTGAVHFNKQGVRTDAPVAEVDRAVREAVEESLQ